MTYLPISLTNLFGSGATQDATSLTIIKSDLVGLTPSLSNSAESLLAAILVKASLLFGAYLTDENGNPIITESKIMIGYKNNDLYEFLNVFIWDCKFVLKEKELLTGDTIVIESYTNLPAWE